MDQLTKKNTLAYISRYLPNNPVIVEAGSFNGTDTRSMSSFWPQGTIHAFEPVPEIFELLTQNTASCPNVHRYPYALSSTTGTATLYVSARPDALDKPFQAGSLLRPKERLSRSPVIYPHTITVPTFTLDAWAEKYALATVDLLWLDLQGLTLPVLQASPTTCAQVRVIYTEVEFIEAYEGEHQYPAVRSWLEGQGFTMVARDFNDTPTWFFGNALFVR